MCRGERVLCEVDRTDTDDTIDIFEIGITECIADRLVGDDEVRCEGHLVEICSLLVIGRG